MAKCEFCDKGVTFGIKVSHSHRRSNRTWKPNVKRVKAIVDGSPKHVYVCYAPAACAAARSPALCNSNNYRNEPVPKRDGLFSVLAGIFLASPSGGGAPVRTLGRRGSTGFIPCPKALSVIAVNGADSSPKGGAK